MMVETEGVTLPRKGGMHASKDTFLAWVKRTTLRYKYCHLDQLKIKYFEISYRNKDGRIQS